MKEDETTKDVPMICLKGKILHPSELLVAWYNIPYDFIIIFYQTALLHVCTGQTTLAVQCTKSVPVVGKGKKKQMTGRFTVTAHLCN